VDTALADVLAPLNLKPGRTYRATVNGDDVELRVLDTPKATPPGEEPSQFADMVMVEPWFEIPPPPPVGTMKAYPGTLPLPDPPVIPPDDGGDAPGF
jgi:hypothetical protein